MAKLISQFIQLQKIRFKLFRNRWRHRLQQTLKKVESGPAWLRFLMVAIGIVSASLAIALSIETALFLWQDGPDVWTGALLAIEAFTGVSLLSESVRGQIFQKVQSSIIRGMFASITFLIVVLVITYVGIPMLSQLFFDLGNERNNNQEYDAATYWFELTVRMDTEGLTEFLRTFVGQEPNSGRETELANAAMQGLAQIYTQNADFDTAQDYYQRILLRDACYLEANWRLAQFSIIDEDFFKAHRLIDSGLQQIQPIDDEEAHCHEELDKSEEVFFEYWLYLTRGRIYVLTAGENEDEEFWRDAALDALRRAEVVMKDVNFPKLLKPSEINQTEFPFYYWMARTLMLDDSKESCQNARSYWLNITSLPNIDFMSPSIGGTNTVRVYESFLELRKGLMECPN